MLLKTASEKLCSLKNYVNLFNVEAFFLHELPPLVFKRFSTILHYSVMTQIMLSFINTFQILNINVLMNFKCKLDVSSYFKKFEYLKCNYDVIGDPMNINKADQTYSFISRTNSDNLMWFSLFSFLQQRAFILILKNYHNI